MKDRDKCICNKEEQLFSTSLNHLKTRSPLQVTKNPYQVTSLLTKEMGTTTFMHLISQVTYMEDTTTRMLGTKVMDMDTLREPTIIRRNKSKSWKTISDTNSEFLPEAPLHFMKTETTYFDD